MAINPIDVMEDYDHARCLKVTLEAERFLSDVDMLSRIGQGLAQRPGPGQKADARQALNALAKELGALRRVVEGTRTLRIVGS